MNERHWRRGWAKQSSINQAPITGESVPVDKVPAADIEATALNVESTVAAINEASRIFAGTINGSGGLHVYVTRVGSDSTLARVVTMVHEAETNQSPTQQFTDRRPGTHPICAKRLPQRLVLAALHGATCRLFRDVPGPDHRFHRG